MLAFNDAKRRLLDEATPLATERVPIELACGRVLRAPLVADRMQPPFDRVMMDGFALRAAEWGRAGFRVAGGGHAGQVAAALPLDPGVCIEVMTGAPLPRGADCVVPLEEVTLRQGEEIRFGAGAKPTAGAFVHQAGSDVEVGREVVLAGTCLGAREMGVAAAFGYSSIEVSKLARIGIVATGDELVAVDEVPLAHQIRQSNGHALAAALQVAGYPAGAVILLGDDAAAAGPALQAVLAAHDWIVLTGAISKGARDFVPKTLERLGCRRVFHGVAQRPGKPMGCWIGPLGQVIIALPGNPVSALTNLHVLALPALDRAAGRSSARSRPVVAGGALPAHSSFTLHLPVCLDAAGRAHAAPTSNSGDFVGLLNSSGCVTLPPLPERPAHPITMSYTPWL